MAQTDNIQQAARRIHTHTVVFESSQDVECACRALLGQTTDAICRETGLSKGQVQYRIHKAQIDRMAYRHGRTSFSKVVIDNCYGMAEQIVSKNIAPKFAKLKE